VARWLGCAVVLLLPAACSYPPLPRVDPASDAGISGPSDGQPGGPSDGQPGGPSVITAQWSFNTYANRHGSANAPCPTGFDTATVYARPWDSFVGSFTGPAVASALFDCAAKVGTTSPLDGVFQVWVQIENHDGTVVYAESEASVVDTANGNASIALPTLFTDAGYVDLSWDLEKSGARVHCSDPTVGSGGQITATAVGQSTIFSGDPTRCTDGFGVIGPLPADTYVVTVTASSGPGNDVGVSDPIDNAAVTAHGLSHLGVIKVTLQ
jgi:hypothetical protein